LAVYPPPNPEGSGFKATGRLYAIARRVSAVQAIHPDPDIDLYTVNRSFGHNPISTTLQCKAGTCRSYPVTNRFRQLKKSVAEVSVFGAFRKAAA
jgi:hypothetical protein